jgi:hypothetical protein
MKNRPTVNKDFDSCKTGNLRINPSNGDYTCISKESPNAKKFDENPCQLLSCPNFEPHKKDESTQLKDKIKKYIKEDKPEEWVIENAPCSRTYYYDIKKELKIEQEKEERRFKENMPLEANNSIKPEIKTNPQSPEKPLSPAPSSTKTNYQRPSNKEFKPPQHLVRIKLNLYEHANPIDAISFAIDKFYIWTPNNAIEVKDYLKKIGSSIKNPQLLMRVNNLVDLYERSISQIGKPSCFRGYVDIITSSPYSTYIYGRHTYNEIFQDVDLPLPPELKDQRNEIIENIDQLKQSGIFDDLIEAIKKELQQEGFLEIKYHELIEGKLNPYQQTELKFKILTNPETFKSDPYYQPIIEILDIKPLQ